MDVRLEFLIWGGIGRCNDLVDRLRIDGEMQLRIASGHQPRRDHGHGSMLESTICRFADLPICRFVGCEHHSGPAIGSTVRDTASAIVNAGVRASLLDELSGPYRVSEA